MKPEIGGAAPLWRLYDQHQAEINLANYVGRKTVVLSFHPLAWTPVCAQQMRDLEMKFDEFNRDNAVAFGISVDSVPCKKAWAESLNIRHTSIPSDFWPHGEVARLYGVFDEENGTSERAVFVINREGIISFRRVYPARQLPDIDEIVRHLQQYVAVAP